MTRLRAVRGGVFALCLTLLASAALAQNDRSGVTGIVTGPDGAPMSGAPVQLKNGATGSVHRTLSSNTGSYTVAPLPPGSYQLSIFMPGYSYQPFIRPDITVQPGQTLQFDVRLLEGDNLSTVGDDPATYLAALRAKAPPTGPAPRTADGKPDLSGVWHGNHDLFPEEPSMLPWAAERSKQMLESNFKDHPGARCLPQDPILTGPFFFHFVQTPSLLLAIFEIAPNVRQVFLDGRSHPKDVNPTWMGHSVGRWEGDTLVVDTTGFNDRSWIGLSPHTEMLHIVERYRRPDLGHLEIAITVEDPGAFAKPWNIHMTWTLAPGENVLESVCENNRLEHLVGK